MEAPVYLQLHHHHRGAALPLPLPPPPIRHSAFTSSSKPPAPAPAARLTVSVRPRSPARSAPSPAVAAHHTAAPSAHRSSSRAATGYAAALADACARAGTLRRAARHARAVLLSRQQGRRPLLPSLEEEEEVAAGKMDARVAALLRMLVGKGRAGMVPEVLAEFAAICDQLLPPTRAHHAY
ncbi:hypothetical protein U9M48_026201 [Paspalum notatum var. saurae]|uniref:Uncharacterized protein n=1 Tax=Paspalum notatum var. saurae TaxID=547442 RepID=A0AAQ3TS84_PASNO